VHTDPKLEEKGRTWSTVMEVSLKLCSEVALLPAGWNGGRLVLVNVETTFSPLSL